MKIIKITNGMMKQNCYVLEKEDKTAIVIDPGLDTKAILKVLDDNKINVVAVVLTHGHFDHIYSAKALKDRGAKIYITEVDGPKLLDNELNMGFLLNVKSEKVIPDGFLTEGENVVNDVKLDVVFTPGHTSGSCVIIYDKYIFTGDTYFEEGIYGRTDLLDGNEEKIQESIKKLKPYLKGKIVCSGHE